MALLLGIDVGSSNCKAVIFDEKGNELFLAKAPTITHYEKGNHAYYDPEEMWRTIVKVIREAIAQINPGNTIDGISVASMAESGLLIDGVGKPITPLIPYFDQRSLPQCQRLEREFGFDRIYEITGLYVNPLFSLTKILWLKENEPAVFSKAKKWLCMTDFVYYRLTGEIATDYTIASRTMALDLRSCSWSEELLDYAGVSPELFPPIYSGGTVIGKVTVQAARETGLAAGIPVAAGGHDHFCGSVASGLLLGNRVINSSGTAESVHTIYPKKEPPTKEYKGFSVGRYHSPDYLYIGGGLVGSGIAVEWSVKRFGSLLDWSQGEQELTYETIMKDASITKPGANGLIFLPHLRGSGFPHWNPRFRGSLIGLRTYHKGTDIIRALIEGLSFEVRGIIEAIREMVNYPIQQITTIGGGSRNEFLLQTKADVTGLPIEIPDSEESTAMGAAIMAGISVGIYRDMKDATIKTYRAKKRIEPDPERKHIYDQLYKIYCDAYNAIEEINERLDKFSVG